MSNEHPGASGSDVGGSNTIRVGTAERDAALARLGDHWQAGRLDPAEHERRLTEARAAVTQGDLDFLFVDLPGESPAKASTGGASTAGTHAGSHGFLDGKRETIMALAPLVALVLFFTTHTWLWFLLAPGMGIVLYGAGGHSRDGRSRGRDRSRRRG